ncbi:hypothetical protein PI124_g9550 [Phytophthora idaei]|nr:hypothetical protein PI125_g9177 [Phytophthora idaei]KAG3157201.1 hypothetical protein PI126_g8424 [Phytophthora idaei]KAG3245717.1 hypothetical protein PI124_g9550 [Phytophthora idaei]
MDLVDRWNVSKVEKSETFWNSDEFGKYCHGADTSGLCMFNALKRAAKLSGRLDIVTQRDIDEFVAVELDSNGRDLTKGTTWKVVLRFLRRHRDDGRDFVYNAIAKNNFAVAGRRGARVLAEIGLVDGIYLVAAYNHNFVGHGIVLTVQGNKRLIYDLEEGKPIASAEDWINFYAFVRPFIVIK